jgi:peptide methionine sulfoxide reductase MsrB
MNSLQKRESVFTCRLCGLPLFKAGAKFESRTGWPSFTAPFNEAHLRRVRDACGTAEPVRRRHSIPRY